MSTVKSKKLQVGTDASASNNFTIYQPATPDGTLRIGVGNADNPTEVGQFNANGYKPAEPVVIMGYSTTNQTIANGTVTKLQYNAIGYETTSSSNYNTSTYEYTIPYNGIYLINHTVEILLYANSIHSGIYVNGGTGGSSRGINDRWQQSGNSVNSGNDHHTTINIKTLNLIAGDVISFYTYHSSGASKNISSSRCSFSIMLLAQR